MPLKCPLVVTRHSHASNGAKSATPTIPLVVCFVPNASPANCAIPSPREACWFALLEKFLGLLILFACVDSYCCCCGSSRWGVTLHEFAATAPPPPWLSCPLSPTKKQSLFADPEIEFSCETRARYNAIGQESPDDALNQ